MGMKSIKRINKLSYKRQ